MMEYKGYIGKVEFDDEVPIFHGGKWILILELSSHEFQKVFLSKIIRGASLVSVCL